MSTFLCRLLLLDSYTLRNIVYLRTGKFFRFVTTQSYVEPATQSSMISSLLTGTTADKAELHMKRRRYDLPQRLLLLTILRPNASKRLNLLMFCTYNKGRNDKGSVLVINYLVSRAIYYGMSWRRLRICSMQ